MEIRKVGVLNSEGTTYITLPKDFAEKGNYIRIDVINDNELKLTLIR